MESCFGLYFQHYLSCLLLVEERSTAYKGNGGRFRTWLQRSVISSPLFTFVDFLLWQVDHQEPVSHPQPSGSTLSSYRWRIIHVAEGLTDAHSWHRPPACCSHDAHDISIIEWQNVSLTSPPVPLSCISIMEKSRVFEDMSIRSCLSLGRNLFRRKLHFLYSICVLLSMHTW